MELSHKTTILLSEELYQRLMKIAGGKHTSLGCVVREACQMQYGLVEPGQAEAAVRELSAMQLPVDDVARMKQQLAPAPGELLP